MTHDIQVHTGHAGVEVRDECGNLHRTCICKLRRLQGKRRSRNGRIRFVRKISGEDVNEDGTVSFPLESEKDNHLCTLCHDDT